MSKPERVTWPIEVLPDRRRPPQSASALPESGLPEVLGELVRATHARASVLTLHPPGRQPAALLFADPSLDGARLDAVLALCRAVRPTFDSGRPFWRAGPAGSDLALMLVPLEPVPDHGQLLLGLLFGATDDILRKRAEQLFRRHATVTSAFFRLWQLARVRDQREAALRGLLDGAARGVALVDRLRRVAFANRALEALLAAADGLCRIDAALHAVHAPADAVLQQVLTDLLDRDEEGMPGRMLVTLPRALGPPLFAVARRGGAPAADPDQRVVALDVLDPRRHDPGSLAAACQRHGLSRGETWVVSRLAGGDTLAEMARSAGVQDRSVRHHLRQALRKTGTASAEELMVAILSSLAGVGGDPAGDAGPVVPPPDQPDPSA